MTPELEALVAALETQRDGVLKKLAGLSEDDARRSTVPSGTNLAGLLQHRQSGRSTVGRPGLEPGTLGLKVPCSTR